MRKKKLLSAVIAACLCLNLPYGYARAEETDITEETTIEATEQTTEEKTAGEAPTEEETEESSSAEDKTEEQEEAAGETSEDVTEGATEEASYEEGFTEIIEGSSEEVMLFAEGAASFDVASQTEFEALFAGTTDPEFENYTSVIINLQADITGGSFTVPDGMSIAIAGGGNSMTELKPVTSGSASVYCEELTISDADLNGGGAFTYSFSSCTFDSSLEITGSTGEGEAEFENCTFDGDVTVSVESADLYRFTADGCCFNGDVFLGNSTGNNISSSFTSCGFTDGKTVAVDGGVSATFSDCTYGTDTQTTAANGNAISFTDITYDGTGCTKGFLSGSTGTCDSVLFNDCNFTNIEQPVISGTGTTFETLEFDGCTFTKCRSSVIVGNRCSGLLKVKNSEFYYDEDAVDGAGYIDSGAVWIEGSSMSVGEISDVKVYDFFEGIHRTNGGTRIDSSVYSNIYMEGVTRGITDCYCTKPANMVIKDCVIKARDGVMTQNGYTNSSYAIMVDGSTINANKIDTIDTYPMSIENCEISGFYKGIELRAFQTYIENCTITECLTGIADDGPGNPVVYDCTITGPGNVPDGHYSTGISGSNSISYVMKSTVTGCDKGIAVGEGCGGSNNTMIVVDCYLENREVNCYLYLGAVYNTVMKGAKVGVTGPGSPNAVLSCVIDGNGVDGSVGINAGGSGTYIGGEEAVSDTSVNSNYLYLTRYNDKDTFEERYNLSVFGDKNKTEIYNCDKGIGGGMAFIYDAEIHDCKTGVSTSSSVFLQKDLLIYDCGQGIYYPTRRTSIYSDGKINSVSGKLNLVVHDCSEEGVKNCDFRIGSFPTEITIYNCKTGDYDGEHYFSAGTTLLTIYGCSDYGIYYSDTRRNANNYIPSINLYDNGCNVYGGKGEVQYGYGSVPTSAVATTYSDGDLCSGYNAYIKKDFNLRLSPRSFSCTKEKYYLEADAFINLENVPVTVNGEMWFDVEDYAAGRILLKGNGGTTVRVANPEALYAVEEGWIVKEAPVTVDAGEGEYVVVKSYNYVLAEGCKVIYDYATNGGTSCTAEDYIYQYEKDSDVDLTPTAVKEGYEFVGWNTDKDAETGLTSLTAGTTDVTLYAIYKKTNTVTFHTFDDSEDWTADVTYYNNETVKGITVADGHKNLDKKFEFIGVTPKKPSEYDGADVVIVGSTLPVSITVKDFYCVYEADGSLCYLDADGNKIDEDSVRKYYVADELKGHKFDYVLKAAAEKKGCIFIGWKDALGVIYGAGEGYATTDSKAEVIGVYEEIPVIRQVTVAGSLSYSNGNPISNKVVRLVSEEVTDVMPLALSNGEETLIKAVSDTSDGIYVTKTDSEGQFEFTDVYIGNYSLELYSTDDITAISEENLLVSASVYVSADFADKTDDDGMSVDTKADNVATSISITEKFFILDALLDIEEPAPPAITLPAPKETPKTGDNSRLPVAAGLLLLSGSGITLMAGKRKKDGE